MKSPGRGGEGSHVWFKSLSRGLISCLLKHTIWSDGLSIFRNREILVSLLFVYFFTCILVVKTFMTLIELRLCLLGVIYYLSIFEMVNWLSCYLFISLWLPPHIYIGTYGGDMHLKSNRNDAARNQKKNIEKFQVSISSDFSIQRNWILATTKQGMPCQRKMSLNRRSCFCWA